MAELLTEKARQARSLGLVLGVALAILGGMIFAAALGLQNGAEPAQALPTDIIVSKSDTGQINGTSIDWWIQLQNNSQTSETIQLSDSYEADGSGGILTGFTFLPAGSTGSLPAASCVQSTASLDCDLPLALGTSYLHVTMSFTPQCQPATVTNSVSASLGGVPIGGSPDANNTLVIPGDPQLCDEPSFQLCKEWFPQGAIAAPRDFTFSVSDTSETRQFTIFAVPEDNSPHCIPISAPAGPVEVTEIVPFEFDTPDWFLGDAFEDTSGVAFFILDHEFCDDVVLMEIFSGPAEDCVVTFVNEDNDSPPVTVTTTPPPTVCARCNAVTPPPPTSTPVPPTNTPAPNTPVPPTATPTTSSGTQNPGLTDEQRTATAVAGAKTAAAAVTPIAPKTGAGGSGGSESTLNLSLAIAGLLVLGTGLGLIGARSRR